MWRLVCQAFGFQCNANKAPYQILLIHSTKWQQLVELSIAIVLKCKLKQVPGEPKQLLHLNVLVRAMTAITVVWTEPTEYAECSKKENN